MFQKIYSFVEVLFNFNVVDSCWNSSTEWSDTFRGIFVYGKELES